LDRYVCVHGHFYQPPRENPWLELVELQESAWPYHDWNERITDECYGPNTAARVLDGKGWITRLINNYGRMSFNVGPTLLAWMDDYAPEVHAAIVAADRRSMDRFGGHGSAMAQVYNHAIMPLANARDQRTQVRWGIEDFRHRFGRDPEGMWLAETAADTGTLEVLAEHGIRFTVLSPYQAAAVRSRASTSHRAPEMSHHRREAEPGAPSPPGGGSLAPVRVEDPPTREKATAGETASSDETVSSRETVTARRDEGWIDVRGGAVDPSRPYEVLLPSGRSIAVFFYDAGVSQAVAFEGLLNSGDALANRLLGAFPTRDGPRLVHIATDGESYGHHHKNGEMALARALQLLGNRDDVALTNYAQYLELSPPTHQVRIVERGSWSCAHGVERWRSDCGCVTGELGRSQSWRAPLRAALDWLRDELAPRFEARGGQLLTDPWAARDDYLTVVLHRTGHLPEFLAKHARERLDAAQTAEVLRLLEMQRYALLMYTSCGWFFDELSRIETVQILAYAARTIQLAGQAFGEDLEPGFLDRLAEAPSNLAQYGDGRGVYEQLVKPLRADFEKVAAHFAISGLVRDYSPGERLGCYEVTRPDEGRSDAGRARVGYGQMQVRSVVTLTERAFEYAVLHFGDHNFLCGIRPRGDDESYERMASDVEAAFDEASFPDTIRVIDQHFGAPGYSLSDLFRDEQRRLLADVLDAALADVESTFRSIYRGRAPLMRFLAGLDAKLPAALESTAEVVINAQLRDALSDHLVPAQIRGLVEEAERFGVPIDTDSLAHAYRGAVERITARIARGLRDPAVFDRFGPAEERFFRGVETLVDVADTLPFEADLRRAQNLAWQVLIGHRPTLVVRAEGGDVAAARWVDTIDRLTERLHMAIPEPSTR
jgi:alpha-amylase/alpha-mannosidase (GH57 family)